MGCWQSTTASAAARFSTATEAARAGWLHVMLFCLTTVTGMTFVPVESIRLLQTALHCGFVALQPTGL